MLTWFRRRRSRRSSRSSAAVGLLRHVRHWAARLGHGRLGAVVTLARRTARDARDDRITGLAAEITFFAVVAIPPLLLVVAGGLGFVADLIGAASTASMRRAILDGARAVLNDSTVRDTIRPTLDNLLEGGRADVMSFGAIVALWSSSRATKVAVVAITIAYDVPPSRSLWRRRAIAVGLTAGAITSAVLVLPLFVVGPGLLTGGLERIGLGQAAAPLATVTHWLVAATLAVTLLTTLYHVAPPRWTPWHRDLPGALLALALWVGGATLLRTYIEWTITSNETYGPFAAPIVILLWLYFTALAVLLGAELNAEIETLWSTSPRRGCAAAPASSLWSRRS